MRRKLLWAVSLVAITAAATTGAAAGAGGSGRTANAGASPRAHSSSSQACADPDNYPATRDPSNPLDLATPPGSNPLNGANFFIDGPAHGAAAGAIAQLLGVAHTSFADNYSWAQFAQDLQSGTYAAQLQANPTLASQVQLLEKIAQEPDVNRFSLYSGGGGPGAIYGQVHKIVCDNMEADPGTIPIFSTYFLYQAGYCESKSEILQNRPTFERQVNELARGIDRRPAVLLLEFDAIGSSRCMQHTGALAYWEGDIRYEINAVAALPHTVVYIEGGYADSNPPGYTAQVLNAVGVSKIRGFFTNDTHEDWTINEILWGERVSNLTHGTHFIVNTATNGRGPIIPPDRVKNGNEVLCNPPNRALGPLPALNPVNPRTRTPFPDVDAFLWTSPPGNSSGKCNGGPASGVFWIPKALGLSQLANAQLGPGWPSQPY